MVCKLSCKPDLHRFQTLTLSGCTSWLTTCSPIRPSVSLSMYAILNRSCITCVILQVDRHGFDTLCLSSGSKHQCIDAIFLHDLSVCVTVCLYVRLSIDTDSCCSFTVHHRKLRDHKHGCKCSSYNSLDTFLHNDSSHPFMSSVFNCLDYSINVCNKKMYNLIYCTFLWFPIFLCSPLLVEHHSKNSVSFNPISIQTFVL